MDPGLKNKERNQVGIAEVSKLHSKPLPSSKKSFDSWETFALAERSTWRSSVAKVENSVQI
jgi:hypothetical protein